MPHANEQDDNELFEIYLDGLMSDADREAFALRLQADAGRRRQAELQQEIGSALNRLFAVETPSQESLAATVVSPNSLPDSATIALAPSRNSKVYGIAAALAASVIIASVLSMPWRNSLKDGPDFAARPLTELYRDAVASGFEPSYECHEPERFAATFQQRQGQALRLLAMPNGARMLGLAYTGGLSRNTTAMLCYVDNEPVMVFVDRSADDNRNVAAPASSLNVFRDERDGLVYYEVTPLAEPRITALLAPLAHDSAADK